MIIEKKQNINTRTMIIIIKTLSWFVLGMLLVSNNEEGVKDGEVDGNQEVKRVSTSTGLYDWDVIVGLLVLWIFDGIWVVEHESLLEGLHEDMWHEEQLDG